MTLNNDKLEAVFFKNVSGSEPVRDWLKELSKRDKRILGEAIATVQYGWPLGMPLVKNIGLGLWEIRETLSHGLEVRIIFFMDADCMILVNSFFKKTQKTPKYEIDLSLKRKKQYFQNDSGRKA